MRNLITDIAGVTVGQAQDAALASGVTIVMFEEPATVSVDVRGGAPGTRETDLLAPERTVDGVDAIALSGGSAFGLEAGGGAMAFLAERGRGYAVGPVKVPIVPGAILFDLLNGGDKAWGRFAPYRELGYEAAATAGLDFKLGTAGAGYGATAGHLKGGIGSASAAVGAYRIGAIAAVNGVGRVTVGEGAHFWAAPFEVDAEFGGLGLGPGPRIDPAGRIPKGRAGENTTLAVIATDARLTKAQARQLAVMAQDGLAVSIHPVHTPFDGDTIFVAATGRVALAHAIEDLGHLGTAAVGVLARAVARAVFEATALPFPHASPSWKDQFGGSLEK